MNSYEYVGDFLQAHIDLTTKSSTDHRRPGVGS